MKRVIKFRGKCKRGYNYGVPDEWVYGSLVTNGEECGIVRDEDLSFNNGSDDGINSIEDDYGFIPVIAETVGQFTGFEDKEGVDIYEDDILECEGCTYNLVLDLGRAYELREEGDYKTFFLFRHNSIVAIKGNIHEEMEG
ncbi:MAG: YopX family protein [Candidatus Bathyarchaeia archaeon]